MADVDKTAERIFWLLSDALSEEKEKREKAELGLREAEKEPDFFASLAMICTSSDELAPPRVRWLASCVGKNAVPRSWRMRTKTDNKVTEEERAFVRETLLNALGEQHSAISSLISLWIARIARIDYPMHWARLIPTVCSKLSPRPDAPHVTLLVLRATNELLEVLASRRLAKHRQALQVGAPPVFAAVRALFESHLPIMAQQYAANNAVAAQASFQIVETSLKCLRQLVIYGYERIEDAPAVHELFGDILKYPSLFLRGADGGAEHERSLSLLAAKLVGRAFDRHPTHFHLFLPRFLDTYYTLLINYNVSMGDDGICAQAARFIRSVLVCPQFNINRATITEFQQNGTTNADDPDVRLHSQHFVLSFFNEARVDTLIHTMITKLFVLREHEAASWVDDPEVFVDEEVAEWSTQSLRRECDKIFKILLMRDKRRIAPKVIALAESVPLSEPLLRDACYRAVGSAVYDLEGLFDFEPWLNGQLGPILQANVGDNVGERILQSRAAWLLGQFVAQLTREARAASYALLVNLMAKPNGDRVVALTSANALYSLAEDMGFRSDDFLPHLPACITATFKLLFSSDNLETRRNLLSLASQLVTKSSREAVVSLLPAFAEAFPIVWRMNGAVHGAHAQTNEYFGDDGDGDSSIDAAGDGNMLKIRLVVFMISLVQKAGHAITLNEPLHSFIHDAIIFGTDMKPGGGGVYLFEDACELWQYFLACSTEYTEKTDKMFNQLPVVAKNDTSRFKEIGRVIESCLYLGREQFLRSHGSVLFSFVSDLLRKSRDRGILVACEITHIVLQLFPGEGVQFVAPQLQYIFDSAVVGRLPSNYIAAVHMSVISRAVVMNIESVETLMLRNDAARVDALFKSMLERVDYLHRIDRMRCVVVALCGLAARYAAAEQVRAHMPAILNVTVQVLARLNGVKVKPLIARSVAMYASQREHQVPATNVNTDSGEALPEDERKLSLCNQDPVNRFRIGDLVSTMISALRACGDGEVAYQKLVHDTGPEILAQLENYISAERSGRLDGRG